MFGYVKCNPERFGKNKNMIIGAVWCNSPIRKSFMQFAELHLSTVANFSLANLTNESVTDLVNFMQFIGLQESTVQNKRSCYWVECSALNLSQIRLLSLLN